MRYCLIKNYNKYGTGTGTNGWDAKVDNETKADFNAWARGEGKAGTIRFTSANNKFKITLRSTANADRDIDNDPYPTSYDYEQTFTINLGTGKKNLSQIVAAINTDLAKHDVVVGKNENGKNIKKKLSTRIEAKVDGDYIKIVDKEDLTLDDADDAYPNWYSQIDLSSDGANTGYRILFQRREDYEENKTYTFTGSTTLTVPSGGFYHHVMCKSEEQTPPKLADPADINGDQFHGDQGNNRVNNVKYAIFAQGRHDLVKDPASLHPNMSDTLILDLNFIPDWNHSGTLGDYKAGEKEVLKTLREQIDVAIEEWNKSAEAQQLGIQLNKGMIEVYSPRFSTCMLGINSICVSMVKNAEKATNRLKEAITKVSEMRNTFDAIQNRIEHTINNNRNKEENTQAGQAILAQANQSRQGMLSLLS